MKDDLIERFPFLETDVDDENITVSLLRLLSLHHCISEADQKNLKADMDKIFLEIAGQYTKRESSTLPSKAAEKIYASILTQTDVYLNSFQNVFKAANILCTMPMGEIVLNGQRLILQFYDEIQVIFRQVYKTRLFVPIQEYQYAINKAFDEFMKHYDARFDAANVPASIDYPILYGNWMSEKGIMFIKAYYTALMFENGFCNLFPQEEILWILKSYGRKYHCQYTDLLFNIAEIVLNNLLAGSLLGKELFTIRLTEKDCVQLQKEYAAFTKSELDEAIQKAFLPYRTAIENPQLVLYLQKYLDVFSLDFLNRVGNGNLKGYICFDT